MKYKNTFIFHNPNLRQEQILQKLWLCYLWVLSGFKKKRKEKGKAQRSIHCVCVCVCVCVYTFYSFTNPRGNISSFMKGCSWILFPLDGAISLLLENFMSFLKGMFQRWWILRWNRKELHIKIVFGAVMLFLTFKISWVVNTGAFAQILYFLHALDMKYI